MTKTDGAKNDRAWAILFERYQILERLASSNVVTISAAEIRTVREARLMAKFDHSAQLPQLFRTHGLAILPTSRGEYVIGHFDAYHPFDTGRVSTCRIKKSLPFQSLSVEQVTSEVEAILLAHHLGILNHFTGDDTTFYATLGGRMGSERFDFEIATSAGNNLTLHIENAQLEIDAGYESEHALYLIEAKSHLADDFIVRQLYYPYRLWHGRVKKRVRLLYLTYSDGVFHLREYRFSNPMCYSSVELVKSQRYVIDDAAFSLTSLRRLLAETPTEAEPKVPFPQADSLERLVNLCEILYRQQRVREKTDTACEDWVDKDFITEHYGFTPRQTDYYLAAGRYLGLIEELSPPHAGHFTLTELGRWIFSQSLYGRHVALLETLFRHAPFRDVIADFLDRDGKQFPTTEQVVQRLMPYLSDYSESTIRRRAATLIAWLGWLRTEPFSASL